MGKIICLYGLAASGKTTQAELIKNDFGFIQFGMGDRLRAEISSGSDLGQKIKTFVDAGILISDELMMEVIKNVGAEIKENGIIFDGFPRIISQAKMLEKIGEELGEDVYKFFYLKISPEEALRRIRARAELTGRSDDKDEDVVKNRFGVFERESKILLDYYGQSGKLVEINGELSIEEVFNEIKNSLSL